MRVSFAEAFRPPIGAFLDHPDHHPQNQGAMEYTTEVLDRTTGDLKTVSLGNWLKVSEYGATKGVGPRRTKSILTHLGLLQEERETSASGRGIVTRRRLTPDAVKAGLGKRIYPRKTGSFPFDVLSPEGQAWADLRWDHAVADIAAKVAADPMVSHAKERLDRLKTTRRSELTPQMEVCFLSDFFPDLAQVDICRITGAPPRMVSLYVNTRADQLRAWRAWKCKQLPEALGITFRSDLVDPQE
ncbi:MAG: hypothetical protein KKA82_04055 [Alphaproteobacteria bacterium]|nr:hypothetical protein [Alphaproteobacteria bacterium]MBU1789763.1 hypothetical protein [Alphaproteobacteria bacterium]MBU2145813.1 hypothetical protein [Alphaproteobacteria bacterium]MBU2192536.1 hypothetical protein [Alphaproteobacteria bacterium]